MQNQIGETFNNTEHVAGILNGCGVSPRFEIRCSWRQRVDWRLWASPRTMISSSNCSKISKRWTNQPNITAR